MSLAIVLVLAAALALGIILRLARTQNLPLRRGSALGAAIRPIDIEAFRNLINASDDDYLRRCLPPADFRIVRRERLRATAAYVQVASANAAALVRVAESVLATGDPRLADAARELVNDALTLRRNAAVALARIYLAVAWPHSDFAAIRVIDRYERMSGAAMLLGRLQNPALPVRISARF